MKAEPNALLPGKLVANLELLIDIPEYKSR